MKPKAKKNKPDPDFLDLFIHRMNMKESQGIDRPRTRIKGEMVTADRQFDMPIRGVYPERGEWETEREQLRELQEELPEENIKDWDYAQKIDRSIDLDLFRVLESVYVPKKEAPPLRKLAKLIREKGSELKRPVDAQKRLALQAEKAWQEALEDLELRSTLRLPPHLRNWEDKEQYPTGHSKTNVALILNKHRTTIHDWVNDGTLEELPSGNISIAEIQWQMGKTP